MVLVLGIDEAGKGPVIGSLFMAGILFNERDLPKLKNLGVKNSKLLIHKKRLELEKGILKLSKKHKIIEITPKEIDSAVNSENSNLNWLEAEKVSEIINSLKPDKAIIDCPSPNLKAYENYILERLKNKKIKLIVEHKADFFHSVVSASSIIAKIHREKNVEKIEKLVGESIGSGYPSNPVCQNFIKRNYKKYPEIFRKSWATYKNIVKIKSQKNIGDY